MSRNRARGLLLNTPRPVRVENNVFDRVSGSALLLAGDADGWYESGGCRDVRVTGNVFTNCLTSAFQYCGGVVSVYPDVRQPDRQKTRYHRNLLVEGNRFVGHVVQPILFATSVSNLVWRRNAVLPPVQDGDRTRFRMSHCEAMSID